MLETKTNIILRYVHDVGQAIINNKIDATHSTTNRARERDLMVAGEERDPTMLHDENTPTNSNIKQSRKIEVELWMIGSAVAAVGVVFCVGFVAGVGTVFMFKILPK
jgi:hypothetical protein